MCEDTVYWRCVFYFRLNLDKPPASIMLLISHGSGVVYLADNLVTSLGSHQRALANPGSSESFPRTLPKFLCSHAHRRPRKHRPTPPSIAKWHWQMSPSAQLPRLRFVHNSLTQESGLKTNLLKVWNFTRETCRWGRRLVTPCDMWTCHVPYWRPAIALCATSSFAVRQRPANRRQCRAIAVIYAGKRP